MPVDGRAQARHRWIFLELEAGPTTRPYSNDLVVRARFDGEPNRSVESARLAFGTYIDYLTTYAASLRSVSRVAGVAECERPSPCSCASPRRRMLRAAFRSA